MLKASDVYYSQTFNKTFKPGERMTGLTIESNIRSGSTSRKPSPSNASR